MAGVLKTREAMQVSLTDEENKWQVMAPTAAVGAL